jgi:hypothetical protein
MMRIRVKRKKGKQNCSICCWDMRMYSEFCKNKRKMVFSVVWKDKNCLIKLIKESYSCSKRVELIDFKINEKLDSRKSCVKEKG